MYYITINRVKHELYLMYRVSNADISYINNKIVQSMHVIVQVTKLCV